MAKRKKNYNWVGIGKIIDVVPDASTSVADVLEIVPAILKSAVPGANTQCRIEAMYIHVHTHRTSIATVDACGIIVWTANVVEGGDSPAQTLDAISTDSRAYANKNILVMAPVPVPPILGTSDLLAFIENDQVMVSSYEYQATRKLDRSNQVLALTINSDVSGAVRCFVQVRCLLSYD